MAIVGILVTAIPGGLSVAHKTTIISNELTTTESIGRSQMDYIQNQTYDKTNNPPVYAVLSNLPIGYSITSMAARLDPLGDGTANDDGIQKITINVKHGTETVYTLVDFKGNLVR